MQKKSISRYALFFAWLIALAAMLATVYSSDILKIEVCHLCWYQRLCIYPLVIILAIANYRDSTEVIPYIIAFPIIGAIFALYQYLEQMIPGFAPINVCGLGPSCDHIYLNLLSFITFPLLSFIACLIIFTLLLLARKMGKQE